VPLSTFDAEPQWLSDATQYFAPLLPDDVTIELSTVETPSQDDTMECVGIGPWVHFDVLKCGAVVVPK
jgi:hypothetical protein